MKADVPEPPRGYLLARTFLDDRAWADFCARHIEPVDFVARMHPDHPVIHEKDDPPELVTLRVLHHEAQTLIDTPPATCHQFLNGWCQGVAEVKAGVKRMEHASYVLREGAWRGLEWRGFDGVGLEVDAEGCGQSYHGWRIELLRLHAALTHAIDTWPRPRPDPVDYR